MTFYLFNYSVNFWELLFFNYYLHTFWFASWNDIVQSIESQRYAIFWSLPRSSLTSLGRTPTEDTAKCDPRAWEWSKMNWILQNVTQERESEVRSIGSIRLCSQSIYPLFSGPRHSHFDSYLLPFLSSSYINPLEHILCTHISWPLFIPNSKLNKIMITLFSELSLGKLSSTHNLSYISLLILRDVIYMYIKLVFSVRWWWKPSWLNCRTHAGCNWFTF